MQDRCLRVDHRVAAIKQYSRLPAETLEYKALLTDNTHMTLSTNKIATKMRKATRAKSVVTRKKLLATPTKKVPTEVAQDMAERKKIGRTLDMAAFNAFHKSNSASMKHWDQKEG